MAHERILVVEDESIIALHVQNILTQLGYVVVGSLSSGEEAIRLAAQARPDVVLMDVRLRGKMNGIETAAQIYARFDIPVIYLTAYAEEDLLEQARITEPYGYLIKPVQDRELRATIEMSLYKHRLNQKLRASEERYRALSEVSSDYAFALCVEPEGRLVLEWINKDVIGSLGYAPEDVRERGWPALVHPDDVPTVLQGIQRLLAGQPVVGEFRVVHKNGQVRWVRSSARPVWDQAQGRVVRIYDAMQDITERRQTEEDVKKLNRDLEQRATELTALNKAGQAIVSTLNLETVLKLVMAEVRSLLDAEGASVLLRDPAETGEGGDLVFAASSGPGASELIGTRLPITAGFAGAVIRDRQAVLVGDAQTDPRFYRYVDAMTGLTTHSLLAVPLMFKGAVEGVIEAINKSNGAFDEHDLEMLEVMAHSAAIAIKNAQFYNHLETALRQEQTMRTQLIQASKLSAMGRMVASVAHELNNPLQTIKNCLFLIQQDLAQDTPAHEFLNMALSEVQRLSNLVTQLRAVYRPGPADQMQVLELPELVDQVRSLVAPHLNKNRIRWEHVPPSAPLKVNGLADQLKQVLLNLSLNAADAMQAEGGTLTISFETAHGQVGVVFQDTGHGIQPEDLPNLFDPFFTTKETGTGLGLAICYNIIEKHGGHIQVESQPGQGAKFTVWLPLVQET